MMQNEDAGSYVESLEYWYWNQNILNYLRLFSK